MCAIMSTGREPYLTWHDDDGKDPSRMPIVLMSPVVKLREGPDFAFGARWALVQYHPWTDRRFFLDMPDEAIKTYFRQWVEGAIEAKTTRACPWHVVEQYEAENSTRLRGVRAKLSRSQHKKPEDETCKQASEPAEDASDHEEWEADWNETQESSSHESAHERDVDTRILKLLYEGNVAERDRREEQQRKSLIFNKKHDYYRQTRCTNRAQEECSAMPAGVMNVHEDSDDPDAYGGEQKEINREMQELRAAEHWVNQEGWNAAGEGFAVSSSGTDISLRLGDGQCRRSRMSHSLLGKGAGWRLT